jgi:peptide/nickel transport system permease protein
MTSAIEAVEAPESPVEVRPGLLRSKVLRQPQTIIGLSVIAIFVVVAVLSPVLAPHPKQQVGAVFAPPGGEHVLGTDGGGADMAKLLIAGARVSLIVGFAAAVVSALIGGSIGLISGFFGGKTDTILMRFTDYVIVIPDVPLMIVAAALFGRSLTNIILIIGVIYWTTTARLIRAQVKSVRERVYVKRARSLGASDLRIILRHVLPQIGPLLIANTVLTVAVAIFDETALSFLGLGDPTAITWGHIIEIAFLRTAISSGAWWAVVPAGLCVALLIMGCFWFGQAIEDALNPRLQVSHLSPRLFRLRPLPIRESRTS